jgi:hypothetical protein
MTRSTSSLTFKYSNRGPAPANHSRQQGEIHRSQRARGDGAAVPLREPLLRRGEPAHVPGNVFECNNRRACGGKKPGRPPSGGQATTEWRMGWGGRLTARLKPCPDTNLLRCGSESRLKAPLAPLRRRTRARLRPARHPQRSHTPTTKPKRDSSRKKRGMGRRSTCDRPIGI